MSEIEHIVTSLALLLKLVADTISIILIGVGLAVASYFLVQILFSSNWRNSIRINYIQARLIFGRFLVLALEFLLAADILATIATPSMDQIAKVGAIALIRTFLSYFLNREIKEEEREKKEVTSVSSGLQG